MRDVLGPGTILGYCTNVHAGATLAEIKQNLERYAAPVRRRVSPNEPMGVGLWFSASSARELLAQRGVSAFRDWLGDCGLLAYTINGFPYSDFHQPVVKHAVYSPDWRDAARFSYTTDLALILAELLGEQSEGSISTLPIGWYQPFLDSDAQELAAENLRTTAERLHQIEAETGRLIYVCLEPEPICALESAGDVVKFYDKWLLGGSNEALVLRHLRICHDVCHAAVVLDDQTDMFALYASRGIRIGKVQISNAIRLELNGLTDEQQTLAWTQLQRFREQRYLHQTMSWFGEGGGLHEDLPESLPRHGTTGKVAQEVRVHFHVPVYLESFGLLKTTRDHIIECMKLLKNSEVKHWEVETYAWDVLPQELKVPDLAEGIAKELLWVKEQAAKIT